MRRFQKRQGTGGTLRSWVRLPSFWWSCVLRPGGLWGRDAAKAPKNHARRTAV